MKKTSLTVFLILLITLLKGQEFFPQPSDNPFWTETHGQLWSCSYSLECGGYYCECVTPVYYKTDTVIQGTTYNRLYSRGVCDAIFAGGPPPYGCPFTFSYTNPESLYAIIRQDTLNKIVYLWDGIKDTLLYDFKNMVVGMPYPATFNNLLQNNLLVVSVDSVELNNFFYKKWNLGVNWEGTTTDSAFAFIMEGIGSSFGILANLVPPFENSDALLCFSENDVVIFPDSNYYCDKTVRIVELPENQFFKVYPNPADKQLTIESNSVFKENGTGRIFDISGKELIHFEINSNKTTVELKTLPEGIYFIQLINGTFVKTQKFIKK